MSRYEECSLLRMSPFALKVQGLHVCMLLFVYTSLNNAKSHRPLQAHKIHSMPSPRQLSWSPGRLWTFAYISKKWDSPHQNQSRSLVALAWWPSGGRQPGMGPCWEHLAQRSGGLGAPVWSPEEAQEPGARTFGEGRVVFHLLVKCWGPVTWSWVFLGCQKGGMEGKALKVAAETCKTITTSKNQKQLE